MTLEDAIKHLEHLRDDVCFSISDSKRDAIDVVLSMFHRNILILDTTNAKMTTYDTSAAPSVHFVSRVMAGEVTLEKPAAPKPLTDEFEIVKD